MKKRVFIISFIVCHVSIIYSQDFFEVVFKKESHDSLYYDKLDEFLTLKVFSAQKSSDFDLNDNYLDKSIEYRSNPNSSFGIGGTYKWLSLRMGVGLRDSRDSIFERPALIDIQAQISTRKLTINFYTGIYKGYYLENSYDLLESWKKGTYYNRADIQNNTYGISSYYVFNSDRYSNRATFLQNEWQKKTAGSLLAGGNLIYNSIMADSSLVPTTIIYDTILHGLKFDRTGYFSVGGNFGYGFTLVLWENWFFNYSILGGLSLGTTSVFPIDESRDRDFKLGITLLNSMGLGFNSERFYAGLNYSNLRALSPLPIENSSLGFNVGKFQFLVAYRFFIKEHKSILPAWMPIEL